jgi:hypothetical protein
MSENKNQSVSMNLPYTTTEKSDDDRSNYLTDIANENDDDAAECAAADLFREFPPTP